MLSHRILRRRHSTQDRVNFPDSRSSSLGTLEGGILLSSRPLSRPTSGAELIANTLYIWTLEGSHTALRPPWRDSLDMTGG